MNFVNDYENPMKQFLLKLNMFKLLTYWWSKLFDFLWTFYNCISLLLYLYQLVYHMLNNVPLTDDIWFDNRLKSGLKGQMFVQIMVFYSLRFVKVKSCLTNKCVYTQFKLKICGKEGVLILEIFLVLGLLFWLSVIGNMH